MGVLRRTAIAVVLLVGMGTPTYMAAGDIIGAEQQEIAKERDKQMTEQAHMPSVSVPVEIATKMSDLPVGDDGFRIQRIIVESDDERFTKYQRYVTRYEGRRIGAKGIDWIANVLTDCLVADGYITTQVSIPDQDVSGGTLRLRIHPGRIEKIRFTKPVAWGTWRTAFPIGEGDVLNVRDLEQGLEQMKRIANQDVTMKLLPGKDTYTSIIELTRTESAPITIGFSIDNGGYESTGKWESSVSVSWYNPLGINDVISYTYGKDIEHQDTALGSDNYYLLYSVPYGRYTFTASTYRNHFHQTVATIQPYISSGVTEGQAFGIERVLRRDRTSKTSVQLQLLRRERHNYIDGEEIDVQKQKTTALELGIRHRQFAGRTQADLYGFIRKGIGAWGAEQQPWEDGVENGTPRYTIWGTQFSLAAPVTMAGAEGMYSLKLVGQYARMRLHTSDQLSIGSRYTVRGFDGERTLSGEYGAYMQNELAIPLDKGRWTPYIGVDIGFVGGPSTEYELGKVLVGSVIGVRSRLTSNISVDVNIGTPIYKPQGFTTGKTTVGVSLYAQI